MKKMKNLGRQGDVLIERRDDITPEQLQQGQRENPDPQGRHILAEGEATGHAHRMNAAKGLVALYVINQMRLLHIPEEAGPQPLEHEEHGTVILPPGIYEIGRQQEFDGVDPRQVMD